MPVTVVLGAQWGDEGKGKMVDFLSQNMDMVIRSNGGDNAGHTVENKKGKFKLHLIPVGIFNSKTTSIIGNGVAVNPKSFFEEVDDLRKKGISCRNLMVSYKAHLIMPWHLVLDELQEKERGDEAIGTTRKGIGPVFSDKIGRFGFRVEDLMASNFEWKLSDAHKRAEKKLVDAYDYRGPEMVFDDIVKDFHRYRNRLFSFVVETEPIIWKALDKNKRILLEGAQGVLLDIDFGSYPQVTSSPCTAAGACQGSGIPPTSVNEVIGVVKTYTTRVCEKIHPFPTEMPEDVAHTLREEANEYGATTGRARRIGWLDIPRLRYAARINGFTSLAITRLDSLGILPQVKICYKYDKRGRPVYLEMSGWDKNISDYHDYSALPKNAKLYLKKIEKLVGVPIKYISVGPNRDQTIVME